MSAALVIEQLNGDIHEYLLRFLCRCGSPLNILSLCAASPVIHRCCKYRNISKHIHRLVVTRLQGISNDATVAQRDSYSETIVHLRIRKSELTAILRAAVFKHQMYDERQLRMIAPFIAFLLDSPSTGFPTHPHPVFKRLHLMHTSARPRLTGHPLQIAEVTTGILHDLVGLVEVHEKGAVYGPVYGLGEEFQRQWLERLLRECPKCRTGFCDWPDYVQRDLVHFE